MTTEPRTAKRNQPRPSRMDLAASVVLPLAVIGLGVALSAKAGGLDALVDLCLTAIR